MLHTAMFLLSTLTQSSTVICSIVILCTGSWVQGTKNGAAAEHRAAPIYVSLQGSALLVRQCAVIIVMMMMMMMMMIIIIIIIIGTGRKSANERTGCGADPVAQTV
jgi:glycerol-3-phosphate dehydrogenase